MIKRHGPKQLDTWHTTARFFFFFLFKNQKGENFRVFFIQVVLSESKLSLCPCLSVLFCVSINSMLYTVMPAFPRGYPRAKHTRMILGKALRKTEVSQT